MEKRVYGLETEYGIIVFEEQQQSSYAFDFLEAFLGLISQKIRPARGDSNIDFFYFNGARIYRDMGHPEYATPECASIKDLIIWDKAGERIFEKAMAEINNNLYERGLTGSRIYLYKNNRDAAGATFGCHENYLVSRQTDDEYLQKCLIPFLVTRQIFCGAGSLERDGFQISQRSRHIIRTTHGSATTGRPIIHLRDEALANAEKWRRLHLVLGDANMSEISGFLKVGTTALVLQMIEDKFLADEEIILFDPVAALQIVNSDLTCRQELKLLRPLTPQGRLFISAVEIQEIYLNWAKEYLASLEEVESEWHEIIKRWEYALICLKDNPMKLRRQVDWVAKKWLMELALAKYGCDWNDFQREIVDCQKEEVFELLKTIDLHYHDIRREFGLYNFLISNGVMEKVLEEEEIALAEIEPPQNTRAKWRSSFLRLAQDDRVREFNFYIRNWGHVVATTTKRNSEKGSVSSLFYFYNDDPLDSCALQIDKFWEKIKTLSD